MANIFPHQTLETLAFSLLSLLGAVATYTDLDRGIVRNRTILLMLGLGALVQGWAIYDGRQNWTSLLILLGISVAFGFGLFAMQYWAAGDGKLFIALCLAVPVGQSPSWYTQLPIRLFSYVTVLAFAYICLVKFRAITAQIGPVVRRWVQQNKGTTLNRILTSWGDAILNFVAFYGLMMIAIALSPINLGILQSILIALGMNWLLTKLPPTIRIMVSLAMAGVAIYFVTQPQSTSSQLGVAYLTALFVRGFLKVADHALLEIRPLSSIKAGHYPADALVRDRSGVLRLISVDTLKKRTAEIAQVILDPTEGALSPEQATSVHTAVAAGHLPGDMKIRLRINIPFAPFLTVGTALIMLVEMVARAFG